MQFTQNISSLAQVSEAIGKIRPASKFTLRGVVEEDGTQGFELDWNDESQAEPTLAELEQAMVAVTTPEHLLEKEKEMAQARIDAHYETLYFRNVPNSAIGAEYDAAYIVAKEWLKDTTKPVPERIKALAETYGASNDQAAQVVIAKRTEAQAVAFDLRGAARLRAKLAIRQSVDAAGVAAAEAAGRAAMEAVVFSI